MTLNSESERSERLWILWFWEGKAGLGKPQPLQHTGLSV